MKSTTFFIQRHPGDLARRVLSFGSFLIKISLEMEDFNQLGQVYCTLHLDPENGIKRPTNTEKHGKDGTRRPGSSHGAI
ncbi:unnamed protein product [Echinostoma caproni]|uniref:Uncharacterized protein n=1 Tax=Echinostoma caproni TaxID=27848 RepID=A0A183BBX3_9TREM|nr:unnamed protein product [Echinostoma caproni]